MMYRLAAMLIFLGAWSVAAPLASAGQASIQYFPVGPIYEYRWKLLELALAQAPAKTADEPSRLAPYADDVTQNRGMQLLQTGDLDVIALGTNAEREAKMLPIKVDILRDLSDLGE